jgi:hypothetical protein
MRKSLSPIVCVICCLFLFGGLLSAQEVQSRPAFIQKETEDGFVLKFGSATFGPYEELTNPPFLSADGKNYVFTLRKNKTENWVLANGKEYGPFRGDWMGDVKVSEDGSSWIVTIVGKTDAGEVFSVVVNGKEYPGVGKVAWVGFPSAGFYYFVATVDKEGGRDVWVVTPGAKFGPYEEVKEIVPSEDKKGIVFAYRNKGIEYLQVKDKNLGAFERIDPIYSGGKKGRAFGYITYSKGSSTIFVGSLQLKYDQIEGWYFTPDGSQWIVKGMKGEKAVLNMNGKETLFDWVNWMPYDNGYFYVAQKVGGGSVSIVLNGKEVGSYFEARETYMTPGGNWGAVVAKKKGASMYSLVVINGKEYEGEALRLAELADGFQFMWLKYAENDQVMLQSLKVAN